MFSSEERSKLVAKAQRERDRWEKKHLGGFEKIYPLDGINKLHNEEYDKYIEYAG